jgi:hypothetical protein
VPKVQATLGHGNIATTSGYLRARPDSSSGLRLDRECFFDEDEDNQETGYATDHKTALDTS